MDGWLLFFIIVVGFGILIARANGEQASSHDRRDEDEEAARRHLEHLRRSGRDWYGYTRLHPANRDGNPYNDTFGAGMLPGTDAWKYRHRR